MIISLALVLATLSPLGLAAKPDQTLISARNPRGTTTRSEVPDALTPASVGVQSAVLTGNGLIRVTNLPNSSSAITLEALIYPLTTDFGDAVILRRYIGSGDVDPYFAYSLHLHRDISDQSPSVVFQISNGTAGSIVGISSGQVKIPFFVWTHVAGVYDGTALKVYVNGLKAGEVSASRSIPNASTFRVGTYSSDRLAKNFFGFVDEVRVWSTPRTQQQIESATKSVESPRTATGLIGYWKFEEQSGTTAYDSSESAANGEYRSGARPVKFAAIDVSGNPSVGLSPSSLDIGVLEPGESASRTVRVSNTGTGKLVGYLGSQGNISVSMAVVVSPGQSVDTTVSIGLKTVPALGNLIFYSNAQGSPPQIPVTGTSLLLKTFDSGNVRMVVQRSGMLGYDAVTGNSGFEYPKNSGKTLIYAMGLCLAAEVGGGVRTATALYSSEFQTGSAAGGIPADPANLECRVYKISLGDNPATNPDYAQWPVDLGAPRNPDGTPRLFGDQTLFAVYNDFNSANHSLGSAPLGAEVQQLIYGFTNTDALRNTVFIRYKIINRSAQLWTDARAAFWSDDDLGNPYDDLVGADVSRDLGYAYNATPYDTAYGTTPPSVGHLYLRGPTSGKPLGAFAGFGGSQLSAIPSDAGQLYKCAQGLKADGTSFVDPSNGNATVYPVNGDPLTGTGWVDSSPSDRRMMVSSSPFTLAAGDSTEILFAVVVAQGTSNLNSVTKLRQYVDEVRSFGGVTSMSAVSGTGQSGLISRALSSPFAVSVTNSLGNPVPGVTVTFAITSTPSGASGQSLSATNVTTNASGLASATLTLGNKIGTYTVSASSSGLTSVTFTAIANAGPATTISVTSGSNQSGMINTALPSAFVVTVTDAGGNPVSGASVSFAITGTPAGANGQSISATNTMTDGNGRASSVLTLGDKVGQYTVAANSSGLSPATFTATATGPNYPSKYAINRTVAAFPSAASLTDYTSSDYRLVGLPGNGGKLIGNYLTGQHKTDWQVYWDNGRQSSNPKDYYVEYDGGNNFYCSTGRAYWLLKKGDWTVNDSVSTAPLENMEVAIPLTQGVGYYLITNPYDRTIPWSSIASYNAITDLIRTWTGNGWTNSSDFEPYVGYLFFNGKNNSAIKIPFTPTAVGQTSGTSIDGDGWTVNMTVRSGRIQDRTVSFGVSKRASDGMDDLEQRKPRGLGKSPEAYFDRPEWDRVYSEFSTDIRPGVGELEEWDVKLRTVDRQEVHLDFAGIELVPEGLSVYLIDESRAKSVDLRASPQYSFVPTSRVNSISILVGNPSLIARKVESIVPTEFELLSNYPNPFNLSTTIPVAIARPSDVSVDVYNILGQRVKQVFRGNLTPGRYYFEWEGKDETGKDVSSGIYLCRFAGDQDTNLSRKMVLTK